MEVEVALSTRRVPAHPSSRGVLPLSRPSIPDPAAVGRDFISQNYRPTGRNDALAMETMERCARTLLLFNYELCEETSFREHMGRLNEERLNAFLKTLMELYDDARERGVPGVAELQSPNVRAR